MTREQKLALVLGFAAVLVVGLLISDHMAAARSASLEEAPHDASVVIDATEGQALRRVVTLPDSRAQQSRADIESQPVEISAQAREVIAALPEKPAAAELAPEPVRFVTGSQGGVIEPKGRESILEQVGDRMANGAEAVAKGIRDITGIAAATPMSGFVKLDDTPGDPVSRQASTERVVIEHEVKANESLYKIAERYYGDGTKWQRIADDNPDRIGRDGLLREGVTLRVFDPTRNRTAEATKPRVSTRSSQVKPTIVATTYTVQSGDTLGAISQELLGTIRRQNELIALNRDVLRDPDRLRAGMVLKLPSS